MGNGSGRPSFFGGLRHWPYNVLPKNSDMAAVDSEKHLRASCLRFAVAVSAPWPLLFNYLQEKPHLDFRRISPEEKHDH